MSRILRSHSLAKAITTNNSAQILDSITSRGIQGRSGKIHSSVKAVKVGKGIRGTTQSFTRALNDSFTRITRSMTREIKDLAPACTVEVQGTFCIVFQLYIIN
jgi:histidine ammonia-lyase